MTLSPPVLEGRAARIRIVQRALRFGILPSISLVDRSRENDFAENLLKIDDIRFAALARFFEAKQ